MATTQTPSPAASTPQGNSVFNHPLGFWFFFWGEFAERCCYYGMRAILYFYMIDRLLIAAPRAREIEHYFMAACYLLPLGGGFLADRFLGKYRTIVGFSIPYIVGQLLLGFDNFQTIDYLFLSLALLAGGSGVIKPNISTLMGETYAQKRPGQDKLRGDAFAMFYGAINIGAALSSFAVPWLRDHYGYAVAFRFPAVLMVVALATFAIGKPFYAVERIGQKPATTAEAGQRWVVLRRILGLFVVVTFFWAIFDQSVTTWTDFAKAHLDLNVFGWNAPPDAIQGLNPILIMLLLPPITILWHALAGWGIRLRPTDKMLIGFVLTGTTMAIMTIAAAIAGPTGKVSILWEVVAYLLITVSEICISVVGLELAFAAAPESMRSFVTGCWLATVFIANIINAKVTPIYDQQLWGIDVTPTRYFLAFTLVMIPVTLAFAWIARRFNQATAPA